MDEKCRSPVIIQFTSIQQMFVVLHWLAGMLRLMTKCEKEEVEGENVDISKEESQKNLTSIIEASNNSEDLKTISEVFGHSFIL